jgi:purine nucleosidase
MGGVFDLSREDLPAREHNIVSDPEAARVVFGADVPITLFPLDITTRTYLGPREVGRLATSTQPLTRLLHAELINWLPFIKARHDRDFTHMHDPLTAAALIMPELITRIQTMRVEVSSGGALTCGVTVPVRTTGTPNVTVVLDADVPRFQTMFFDRILQLGRPPQQTYPSEASTRS